MLRNATKERSVRLGRAQLAGDKNVIELFRQAHLSAHIRCAVLLLIRAKRADMPLFPKGTHTGESFSAHHVLALKPKGHEFLDRIPPAPFGDVRFECFLEVSPPKDAFGERSCEERCQTSTWYAMLLLKRSVEPVAHTQHSIGIENECLHLANVTE